MGNRYGRNQRRRLREWIEQLEAENKRLKDAADRATFHCGQALGVMTQWDQRIIALLGTYSALRKEAEIRKVDDVRRPLRWDFSDRRINEPVTGTPGQMIDRFEMKLAFLDRILVDSEEDVVNLRLLIRFRMYDDNGGQGIAVNYPIDARQFFRRTMNITEAVTLGHSVATQIMTFISKQRGR